MNIKTRTTLYILGSQVLPRFHNFWGILLPLLHLLGQQVGEQADNIGNLNVALLEASHGLIVLPLDELVVCSLCVYLPLSSLGKCRSRDVF